jgi:hypothetical protein
VTTTMLSHVGDGTTKSVLAMVLPRVPPPTDRVQPSDVRVPLPTIRALPSTIRVLSLTVRVPSALIWVQGAVANC